MHRKLKNSVVDKEVFDNSIEKAIFSLFRIDVINLIRNKVSLAKNFHIQPSELEIMPMWEYELFMDELNNRINSISFLNNLNSAMNNNILNFTNAAMNNSTSGNNYNSNAYNATNSGNLWSNLLKTGNTFVNAAGTAAKFMTK